MDTGVEFTITSRVLADALGVPIVRELVYSYEESPPLDDVMSYITGSSIQWGFDPRLHIIPLERCVFLYVFVSVASISFPHLFLRSLNEVHRSFAVVHALIHPIFIHRILLFLSLDDFPASEPVHVIAPIDATFFRQRVAHLRVGPMHPRGASFGVVPPLSSSIGADTAEASSAAIVDGDVPPPTTSDDSDI